MKLNWNFGRGGGHTANPFQQQQVLFPWGVWIFSGTTHFEKKQDARCAALKQIIFCKKGGKWDL